MPNMNRMDKQDLINHIVFAEESAHALMAALATPKRVALVNMAMDKGSMEEVFVPMTGWAFYRTHATGLFDTGYGMDWPELLTRLREEYPEDEIREIARVHPSRRCAGKRLTGRSGPEAGRG